MRTVCRLVAVAGAIALVLAVVLDRGWGDPSHAVWVVIGPLPFYVVGLVAFIYRSDNLVVRWLLAAGALFAISTLLGDTVLALRPGPAVALSEQWVSLAAVPAIVGLVGLFPGGRPDRRVDRVVLAVIGVQVALLPVLGALSN